MLFKYTGVAQNGKSVNGTIEATDKNEAIAKLKARSVYYKKISEYSPSLLSKIKFKKKERIKASILSTLSRDLAVYLNAGISIVNGIKLASSQYSNNKKVASFLSSLATFLDEGKSFSVSLELQQVYDLPLFYRQSIKVSEDGGILGEVLMELSKFLKEQERIAKQISSALAYPLFIILVSVLMISFMMVVVVPKITSIFAQMNEELPPITQFTIGASEFLSSYWHILAILFVMIVVLFKLALQMNRSFKYLFDLFILKIPFFGKTVEVTELARFSYMSSMLLRSGLPFVQAITLSSRILKNSVIADLFQDAANRVVEGERLSTTLHGAEYKLQKSFVQAIALGEETSELQSILSNLSNLYFEENRDRIGIFLSLLEPILMLVVGGAVGFIIASMLLPIFSLNIS